MICNGFSSYISRDIFLGLTPSTSNSLAGAPEIYPAPRSVNLMALFALATKKWLIGV
jgi:hypothetical protein